MHIHICIYIHINIYVYIYIYMYISPSNATQKLLECRNCDKQKAQRIERVNMLIVHSHIIPLAGHSENHFPHGSNTALLSVKSTMTSAISKRARL